MRLDLIMRYLVLAALMALGGCAAFQQGQGIAAETLGRAVVTECALGPVLRQSNLDAINGWLDDGGYRHRATAIDCDGDGMPDF